MSNQVEQDAATEALILQLMEEDFNRSQSWSDALHNMPTPSSLPEIDDSQLGYGSSEQAGWTWDDEMEDESDSNEIEANEARNEDDDMPEHHAEALNNRSPEDLPGIDVEGTEGRPNIEDDKYGTHAFMEKSTDSHEASQQITSIEPISKHIEKERGRGHRPIDWNAVRGDARTFAEGSRSARTRSLEMRQVWNQDHVINSAFYGDEVWEDTRRSETRRDESSDRDMEDDTCYENEIGIVHIPLPGQREEEMIAAGEMVRQKADVHEIILDDDRDLWSLLGDLIV